VDHALAFWDVVIYSWRVALEEVVLGVLHSKELPWGKKEFEGTNPHRLNTQQAIATLAITEVCDMIQVWHALETFVLIHMGFCIFQPIFLQRQEEVTSNPL